MTDERMRANFEAKLRWLDNFDMSHVLAAGTRAACTAPRGMW